MNDHGKIVKGTRDILRSGYQLQTGTEVSKTCLAIVKELTNSQLGFLGISEGPNPFEPRTCSDNHSLSYIISGTTEHVTSFEDLHDLCRPIRIEGKSLFTNEFDSYVWRANTLDLHSFMGVPLLNQGSIVGVIGVANREDGAGYSEVDLKTLEALSEVVVQAFILQQSRQALRKSRQQLSVELESAKRLQEVSTQLIQADEANEADELYDKILDVTKQLLKADFTSIQTYHPEHGANGALELLGHRGFSQEATNLWQWVTPDHRSTCGLVLSSKKRVAIPNVCNSSSIADTDDQEMYLELGIRAVQTTPLLARTGELLGAFSTHWREPHELTESEVRTLDQLARLIADLLERKKAEESLTTAYQKLRVTDREKDAFIGQLSHEIRNPLASALLNLSLLMQNTLSIEQVHERHTIITRQLTQISRLVDDLLDITRISQNKVTLRRSQVELNELVRQTVEDYQIMYRNKGVELTTEFTSRPLYINADRARLVQVLGNLLHNSLKFTDVGGITKVSLIEKADAQKATILVADNGVGIDASLLPSLFEPFSRTRDLRKHNRGGLGLGLGLAKGLTELHGGTITAHSDGHGQGATFAICLPITYQEEKKVNETKKIPECAQQSRLKILIIEDFVTISEALHMFLELEGHQVMVAHDGVSGIATAKTYRPNIVLCDIGLPSMNGYEVAKNLQNELEDTVLVALTGYTQPQDIKRVKEAGFHHYLAKPVNFDTLRATLAKFA